MGIPNNKMMQSDIRRQWEQILARAKGAGLSTKKEVPMLKWKRDDSVLEIVAPPSLVRRRNEECWRQRRVDAQREHKREILFAFKADAPISMCGAGAYVSDPELPWSERWLPINHLR